LILLYCLRQSYAFLLHIIHRHLSKIIAYIS
jgi:hypothetical protein